MIKKIIFAALAFGTLINAQLTDFHPELDWYTISGKNVEVHFHKEAERTAQVVAKIADEVWDPITSLYQFDPGKVHYVIKDIDDYSNGATFFFDNKIEIWSSSLDFDLRGTHNWLRNVITHEFTHMVQIQAAMKFNRRVPAIFLQYLNYEDKRRPDILYGFPNFIASYPLATVNVPAWFAEGTAQYMRKELNYDFWDSHRDMILRCYALNGNMLTWNQMGVFGKTSLGNESVYNSGFAFTSYISQEYGEAKLREINNSLSKISNFTIDAAFEETLGKDGKQLYSEWKNFIVEDYKKRSSSLLNNLVQGDKISDEGFGNFYPYIDGKNNDLYYISNRGLDYFGLSSIYKYNLDTEKSESVVDLVRSTITKHSDFLYYSKLGDDNPGWVNIHDIYSYNVNEEKEKRLTFGLRANNPDISDDGSKIVFVYQKDGTINLGLINSDGSNFKSLTNFKNGEQIYFPKFSPDGKNIIFDFSYANGRDIALYNLEAEKITVLLNDEFDERNSDWINNNEIIYSKDETGIFNLYKYNLDSGKEIQITNVIGGAFMPTVDSNGNIFYAGYTSTGYKIFQLKKSEQKNIKSEDAYVQVKDWPLSKNKPNGDIDKFDINSLTNYDDKNIKFKNKEKYSGAFTRLTVMPFLRIDNYSTSNDFLDNVKPGVYLMSNDILNRFGFFAGASINKRMERDLFFIFEYKNKLPILYSLGIKPELSVELYSISRKANVDIFFGADTNTTTGNVAYDHIIATDVTYNLFEADFIMKHRLFDRGTNIEFRYIYSKYTSTLESFVIPNGNGLYPSLDDTYLKGHNLRTTLSHEFNYPYRHTDINPIGRKISLEYNYESNQFNNDGNYEIVNGMLKPNYNDFNFHKLELNWNEHIQVFKNHTISAKLRAASILGSDVPDFFDFYLGGLIGMKSFPFYAISGNELGWLNLTYRFPIATDIDARLGHIHLDKVFMSVYADYGNAWNGSDIKFDKFKKGIGTELRFKFTSFYLFPTSLFFNAAYSFDSFEREVYGDKFSYGEEWIFYGGILFDFPF